MDLHRNEMPNKSVMRRAKEEPGLAVQRRPQDGGKHRRVDKGVAVRQRTAPLLAEVQDPPGLDSPPASAC
jgi:hypothetical protein